MDQTFAPDFHEFGRSGSIHTRAELLLDNWPHDFEAILHDVTVRHLAPDIARCTYISEVKTPPPPNGPTAPPSGTTPQAAGNSAFTKAPPQSRSGFTRLPRQTLPPG